jgi:prepilin-type processing-associated H-X9-DG protein
VIAIAGILFWLLMPSLLGHRENQRKASCNYNCNQIQSAITQFAEANGRLPYLATTLPEKPASATAYVSVGWVPQILAFLDRDDLYQIYLSNANSSPPGTPYNFDGTQAGPQGYMFIQYVRMLDCPDALGINRNVPAVAEGGPADAPLSYAVNAGFTDQTTNTAEPLDYRENGLFFDQALSFVGGYPPAPKTDLAYIAKYDGTAKTILFGENLDASFWAQYDGDANAPVSFIPYVRAPYARADETISHESSQGLVWFDYSDGSTPTVGLNQSYDGRQPEYLAPFGPNTPAPTNIARPSSLHPGGFHITFCDGHTLFMSQDVAYQVYAELMTPRGSHARPTGSGPYVAGSNPSQALQKWQTAPLSSESLSP